MTGELTFQDVEQKAREMMGLSVDTDSLFVVIHPRIWAGYWHLGRVPKPLARFLRWLGHKLNSRHIYWLGFPVRWISGLEEYQ
jgi:hypothetical protein